MDIEASYNFRRINDKLTTSGIVRPEGLKSLASLGYSVVINLLPDTSEYAVPNERDLVESQGIEYIHIPVDFKQPTERDLAAFCEALDRVVGRKVHVHCAANYRVSAFYSLYEVNRGGWSIDQAMEFIRNIWEPGGHPAWAEFAGGIVEAANKRVQPTTEKGTG